MPFLKFLRSLVVGLGKIALALVVLFAVFSAYGLYADRVASRKAAAMCASILPGADAAPLVERALEDGASTRSARWSSSGGFDTLAIMYVGMPPLSRFLCMVKAKDGRVVSAEQAYID
ncbi:hypothetical protein [Pseudoxanthomonas sp. PXM01]|uniref:hypothetical protein n=1 Tax=Pseudoxanthomonas sp. PXM01 TaxID=2769295 RepID=UPI001781F0C1|nr:hypothetical protein [Pseudoxanthomonas sp. PXM01]MBD9469481.1 hypothetical protein [Pseudoxanthomonas sp. PXM01]